MLKAMHPLISPTSASKVLASLMPEAEWLLAQIESENGWFRFPSIVSDAIRNLKIESYPLLYESERAIVQTLMLALMTEQELLDVNRQLEQASLEERDQLIEALAEHVEEFFESLNFPKTVTERANAEKAFRALSPKEQTEAIVVAQRCYSFFLCSFFQTLSIMVHGEALTSLVDQAKRGDDLAYVKAVQIDRRILTSIPYFKERFARAQDDADSEFCDRIAYRLKSPPFQGKIRFKSLWLTFSFLDQLGLLDILSHSEILDMCDKAGVGGYKNRIEDVKNLSKRLRDYRAFQRRGRAATP